MNRTASGGSSRGVADEVMEVGGGDEEEELR